ncbi:MAG: hypothetical protein IPL81_02435 [Flavobacteriales bacterium]|nr:hypothetical protein [Flavobacteriales bacterium]
MEKQSAIKVFEEKQVRTVWDADQEKWFFSIIDVIAALTGSPRPRKYWNALKTKLQEEGSELSHILGQLKLPAEDGKMRMTDVADTEQLFRPARLFVFAAFAISTMGSFAQTKETVPFTDLFTIRVDTAGGEAYLNVGPDSIPGNSQLNARCTALWHYHSYLFDNYAKVYDEDQQLLALLPDTVAMRTKFHTLLDADTAFQHLYMRSIDHVTVAPLPLDSAMWIASHFFYLHRVNGRPSVQICTGVNKVKEMSEDPDQPQYAAFCYMVIRGMEDPYALLSQVIEPYRAELKDNPSDERLSELENTVYDAITRSPSFAKQCSTHTRRKPNT